VQAEGHPIIEFVLSDNDVLLAHPCVKRMNFIPRGCLVCEEDPKMPFKDIKADLNNFHMDSIQ
jgi:hypothetical protein